MVSCMLFLKKKNVVKNSLLDEPGLSFRAGWPGSSYPSAVHLCSCMGCSHQACAEPVVATWLPRWHCAPELWPSCVLAVHGPVCGLVPAWYTSSLAPSTPKVRWEPARYARSDRTLRPSWSRTRAQHPSRPSWNLWYSCRGLRIVCEMNIFSLRIKEVFWIMKGSKCGKSCRVLMQQSGFGAS